MNARQELFAQGVATGRPASRAYKDAGYKVRTDRAAEACAHKLLRNAEVIARIRELQDRKAEKVVLSRAWVLEELRQNYERAMEVVPVLDREGNETGKFTYAGTVANKAVELIGKELGMFVARKKVEQTNRLEGMSDEQLDELAVETATTPSGN